MVAVVLSLSFVAGCARTFTGKIRQPNPLNGQTHALRKSEPVTILTGDMELRGPRAVPNEGLAPLRTDRFPLRNVAAFTVVSRHRLRFHVQLEHKWEEYTDLNEWKVELYDDRGRRYRPEGLEVVATNHVVSVWDYESRTVQRDRYGDITAVNSDPQVQRNALGSLVMYRGRGDVVFYSRDIFTRDVQSLTLRLSRATTEFEFTWRFS